MVKHIVFLVLFTLFLIYSLFVYTYGTDLPEAGATLNAKAIGGKMVFQKYNCTSCHQIYGLGGYLGPDLTRVYSATGKGELYIRAILKTGTQRMPDFHLTENETDELVEYFRSIDHTHSICKK